jgi:ribA/ribD-fused uncharacterized protein
MTEYVFFWKPNKENGAFCQWYESPFTVKKTNGTSIRFNTAEQYMMYKKAVVFNDMKMAEAILAEPDPAKAKALGRRITGFVERVWKQHRLQVAIKGNYYKFTQNPALLKMITELSPDVIFVEASPSDRTWGIGYTAENALAHVDNWGMNLLGHALKRVQILLLEKGEKPATP